ncbi:PH domain-containing protein [Agromyces sp. NPDC056523]|uniref:PH domain-containing protein n=1 Tax=Agromyces sp. NPDC056523 TaxID=3345850 RepID=UPI00366D7993
MARLRRHGRVLAVPALLLIATAGATAYLVPALEGWPQLAVLIGAALIAVIGCALPYLAWLASRATITTRRIIVRRGVFVRVRRELWHRRGYDVQISRSWLQRLIGSGDVRLETGHEVPIVMKDLPGPLAVQAALHELMAESHALGGPAVGPSALGPPASWEGGTFAWGGR